MIIPDFYPRKLPQAILFDWDNTLVDTGPMVYNSLNFAREALGLSPFTQEEFWGRPHHSIRDSAFDLFGENFAEGEHLFYTHIQKVHLKELSTLQGAEHLLEDLNTRGVYMGVVSNKEGIHLRKEVDHLGWKSHFRKIIGSKDTHEDKPSALPVLAALQESEITAGLDVWFVGDSIIDVHCARASGCIPVVVGYGEASQQNDIIHAKDCSGLAQLIKNL